MARKKRNFRLLGPLTLLAAIALLLSLLSFSQGKSDANWLGITGHVVSSTLLYSFGLGSYFIVAALCWLSLAHWRDTPLPRRYGLWLGILLLASCILMTILVERFPPIGLYLRHWIYTDQITHIAPLAFREVRFHLGGFPFSLLYHDLPLINFKRLLGPVGTSLICGGLSLLSFLVLSERSPLLWMRELIRRIWARRKRPRPAPAVVAPVVIREAPRVTIAKPESPPPPPPPPRRPATGSLRGYKLPSPTLLTPAAKLDQTTLLKGLKRQGELLEETLASFGIEAKVGDINCGPTITSFEVHPAVGVKVQKIKALEKDLALNLRARAIRLIAPIPGKAAVGVEIPNPRAQEVGMREMLEGYHKQSSNFRIPLLIGKAVNGEDLYADLVRLPHLLIAGATGSGKSVCLNTLIMTILMTARPDEVKLLMVDPKKVELTGYSELPHMIAPVITEPKEACTALHWLVKEMERRYDLLRKTEVRNIEAFNQRERDQEAEAELDIEVPDQLSYIVAIIDELADLMMVSSSDIESPITRIAQMARAVGIHLVLATQRPSREVLTGLIKANFPTRLAFKVSSRINSQIILDEPGAETLLGNGDLLFRPPGTHYLTRAQGPFVRDRDINAVVDAICRQAPTNYLIRSFCEQGDLFLMQKSHDQRDELYERAYDLVLAAGVGSTTFLQRKLKIGYARAASLMDELEDNGVVAPAEGSKARRVLISRGG